MPDNSLDCIPPMDFLLELAMVNLDITISRVAQGLRYWSTDESGPQAVGDARGLAVVFQSPGATGYAQLEE